jgi:ABC-type polysaccharide/polyol phosphate export permease
MLLQAGFFLAPIIYPLQIVPDRYHSWLYLWPPTPIIQFTRSVLVAGQLPSVWAHLTLAVAALLVLIGGAFVFRRLAPSAAEHL